MKVSGINVGPELERLGELTLPGGEKEVIITPKWGVGRWRGYATGANGGEEGEDIRFRGVSNMQVGYELWEFFRTTRGAV